MTALATAPAARLRWIVLPVARLGPRITRQLQHETSSGVIESSRLSEPHGYVVLPWPTTSSSQWLRYRQVMVHDGPSTEGKRLSMCCEGRILGRESVEWMACRQNGRTRSMPVRCALYYACARPRVGMHASNRCLRILVASSERRPGGGRRPRGAEHAPSQEAETGVPLLGCGPSERNISNVWIR